MGRYDHFVEFMSSWNSIFSEYVIRIPLYGFFAYFFGLAGIYIIINSWGYVEYILYFLLGLGILIFSVFAVAVAVLGAIDSKDRETKAFGYRSYQEKEVCKEIENILQEQGLKYHITGPKWNLFRFQKYSEIYCLDGWTIRCFSHKAIKGPYYEAVILEIGPIAANPQTIENIKHALDKKLKPFHLG